MFPSADPFAYPNQPLMEYDNIKQEDASFMNGSPPPQMMFQNGGTGGRMYDDLEGQLFGPIPPYLQQGQQNYALQPPMAGSTIMGGMDTSMGYHTGMTPGNDDMMGNFDSIFSGDGDEWGNMLNDPRFRQ